jgi:hypothetical protein
MACRWCGKELDEHLVTRPANAPVPRMPCSGLRSFYLEEKVEPEQPLPPDIFVGPKDAV